MLMRVLESVLPTDMIDQVLMSASYAVAEGQLDDWRFVIVHEGFQWTYTLGELVEPGLEYFFELASDPAPPELTTTCFFGCQ